MKTVLPASLECKWIFIDLHRNTQKPKWERYNASNKTVQFAPGFYLFSLEYIFVVRIWAISSEKLLIIQYIKAVEGKLGKNRDFLVQLLCCQEFQYSCLCVYMDAQYRNSEKDINAYVEVFLCQRVSTRSHIRLLLLPKIMMTENEKSIRLLIITNIQSKMTSYLWQDFK